MGEPRQTAIATTEEPPRILATLRGNDDLLATLRARAHELDISRQSVDLLADLTPGMAAKFLSDPPMRNMSTDTLFGMAAALGGVLLFAEDAQSLALVLRAPKRRTKRVLACGKATMLRNRHSRRVLRHMCSIGGIARAAKLDAAHRSRIASKGGRKRRQSMSPQRRQQIAKNAATIRWQKVRAIARGPLASPAARAAEVAGGLK
jgi:hypothetical protein